MRLIDELDKLSKLHASGALTDDEFAAAKAKVIEGHAAGQPASTGIEDQLLVIAQQNEVAELDREWEIARKSYMVPGKYGHRHIPSQVGSVVVGVVIGLFGVFWTVFAFGITGAMASHGNAGGPFALVSFFPLFGILFTVVGVGMCIYSFGRATDYAKAEREYRERRAKLVANRPNPPHDSTGIKWM